MHGACVHVHAILAPPITKCWSPPCFHSTNLEVREPVGYCDSIPLQPGCQSRYIQEVYCLCHRSFTIYLNLVVLSAATLADMNSPALVYSLVGVTLAPLIGIMVYHFHIRYVTRTAFWQMIEMKVTSHF